MSTLTNIVLTVVLNLFSFGTIYQSGNDASTLAYTKVLKKQDFKLKDLRSDYVITKEELNQYSLSTN